MDDRPEQRAPADAMSAARRPAARVVDPGRLGTEPASAGQGDRTETLPVLEESLTVAKRRRRTGRLRVSTTTETHEAFAEAHLDRNTVDVTRVPSGRVVDGLPPVRTEGSTTIVPVVEERLVVVKQLVLTEELHITQKVTRETVHRPVDLRRQRVVIERFAADDGRLGPDAPEGEPLATDEA